MQRFVRVLAVAVAVLLTDASRAFAATTLLSVEAETMTTSSGRIRNDAKASGGRAVRLAANRSLSTTVALSAPASSITLTARGDQCQRASAATIRVDGAAARTVSVASTAWTSYAITTATAAGRHDLTLTYTKDVWTKRCDNSLSVDKVTFLRDSVP